VAGHYVVAGVCHKRSPDLLAAPARRVKRKLDNLPARLSRLKPEHPDMRAERQYVQITISVKIYR